MKHIRGSKTNSNIIFAFCYKSQIINVYSFFSRKAKKEGFLQISDLFFKILKQEKEHSKILFNLFEDENINFSADIFANSSSSTLENLKISIKMERHKYIDMFPIFSKMAKKEGFVDIASTFQFISKIEKQHEKIYRGLVINMEKGKFFRRNKFVLWRCKNCGYSIQGKEPPIYCSLCLSSKIFFEVFSKI